MITNYMHCSLFGMKLFVYLSQQHISNQHKTIMNRSKSHSRTFVVEKTSTALVNLLNKLRDQKMTKLEELRSKKSIYFPASESK